jgi:hypothetical protein
MIGVDTIATASGRLTTMEATKPSITVQSVARVWPAIIPVFFVASAQIALGAGIR